MSSSRTGSMSSGCSLLCVCFVMLYAWHGGDAAAAAKSHSPRDSA